MTNPRIAFDVLIRSDLLQFAIENMYNIFLLNRTLLATYNPILDGDVLMFPYISLCLETFMCVQGIHFPHKDFKFHNIHLKHHEAYFSFAGFIFRWKIFKISDCGTLTYCKCRKGGIKYTLNAPKLFMETC